MFNVINCLYLESERRRSRESGSSSESTNDDSWDTTTCIVYQMTEVPFRLIYLNVNNIFNNIQ